MRIRLKIVVSIGYRPMDGLLFYFYFPFSITFVLDTRMCCIIISSLESHQYHVCVCLIKWRDHSHNIRILLEFPKFNVLFLFTNDPKKKIVFMQKKNPLTTLQCLTLAQYRSSCTGFFLPNIDERSIIIDKDNFLRNERKENSLLSSSVLLTIHGQINSN